MMLLALPIGVLLGSLYFAGLWWSLAPDRRWRQPVVALGFSWLLRTALTLTVFVAVLKGAGPWALLLTLFGFLLARSGWLRRIRRAAVGAP
jgi:F1F0 ATPase subunit 2